MERLNYDHSQSKFTSAIGLTKEQTETISDIVATALSEGLSEGKKQSEIIETVLNQVKTDAEIVFTLYLYGKLSEKHDQMMERIADKLQTFLKRKLKAVIGDDDIKKEESLCEECPAENCPGRK